MKMISNKSTDNYEPAAVLEQIRARRGATGLLNLDRMLLHSPPLAEGWNLYVGKVRREFQLPDKLRELAICVVAILNGAEYEMHHHAPLWIKSGATAQQVAALRRLDQSAELAEFDATERAVIQLTMEMTRKVHVTETTLRAAREHLPNDRQLVELIAVVATYNMVSRFLVATGVEIETG
jgi:alkylhydroperoxidase family enzyme